jgi:hypothetical protein
MLVWSTFLDVSGISGSMRLPCGRGFERSTGVVILLMVLSALVGGVIGAIWMLYTVAKGMFK